MPQENHLEHISIIPRKNKPFSRLNARLSDEVEKIITLVADQRAVPSLIDLLDDNDYDVRWIAAESLIRLGHSSIVPLLRTINEGRIFRHPQKVRHVLENILTRKERKELNGLMSNNEASDALRKILSSGG